MKPSASSPLIVGFDLDGVLLYNPVRIFRPIIAFVKKKFLKKNKTSFYYPKGKFQKVLFRLFHKSSFMTSPGIDIIRNLVNQGQIKAYIITARFDYLKPDLDKWLEKIKADEIFTACYHNAKDEQPHEFKLRMVKKLNLDVFVEDNWDIVKHLNQLNQDVVSVKPLKVFWITNIIDMHKIDYPFKYIALKDALYQIIRQVPNK